MRGLGRAVAVIALLAGISTAGVKYVAVVETDVDASSGASAELNPAEVRQITAELRRVAVENLPRDKYNVMTSETVQSMGGAILEECANENCVITLGTKIGADYIVRGIISKFGTKLTLAVEMYETKNGTLVSSSEPVRSENKTELLDVAAAACGNMYRKFAGTQNSMLQPKSKMATTSTVAVPTNDGMCTLTTNVSPLDGGSVVRNPKKEIYTVGEKVTVTATPANGYTFIGWAGAVESDKPRTSFANKLGNGRVYKLTVTMDNDKTLTANFRYSQQTLTTNVVPAGCGTIVRDPDKKIYTTDENVRITAVPANGYEFTGWSGAATSTKERVTVKMNNDKSLTANFYQTDTTRTKIKMRSHR